MADSEVSGGLVAGNATESPRKERDSELPAQPAGITTWAQGDGHLSSGRVDRSAVLWCPTCQMNARYSETACTWCHGKLELRPPKKEPRSTDDPAR